MINDPVHMIVRPKRHWRWVWHVSRYRLMFGWEYSIQIEGYLICFGWLKLMTWRDE